MGVWMVDGIARGIPKQNLPLCPNSTNYPMNEAHRLHNRVLDAFGEAASKDEDGEFAYADTNNAYENASCGSVSDRMNLFHSTVSFVDANRLVVVGAWWFRCGVCGLVLPAQVEQTRP